MLERSGVKHQRWLLQGHHITSVILHANATGFEQMQKTRSKVRTKCDVVTQIT